MSVCVYALSAGGVGRLALTGVTGERLRRIRVGAVEAVVGDVARRPRPTEANLRRYDRILTSLWARTPALLPVRFGAVLPDRADLERVLEARHDTLSQRLASVRNRAQMTVRILPGTKDPRSPIPDPRSSGTSYLRARARASDVPEFARVRPALRRWVRAERVETRGNVATMYHLVPRSGVQPYRRAIARAARQADVRLLVSGPWPAYAFAGSW